MVLYLHLSAFLIGVVCAKEGMLEDPFVVNVVKVKVILEGLKDIFFSFVNFVVNELKNILFY